MKKFYLLCSIALALLSANTSAQNLILNPSFEASSSATTNWGQWSPNNTNSQASVQTSGGKTGANFLRIAAPCDLLRFQDVNSITAGNYSLKAWVRSSGGIGYAVLYGRGYATAAPDVTTGVAIATNTWTQVVINNINITTGTIQVGIQVTGGTTGQFVEIDDVELVASAFVPPNFVKNPGFEANNSVTATPANWGKWTGSALPNALAQASVVTGGSHSGNYHGRVEGGPADVMFTQGISGLANGTYTFKGWFRNSGPIGWARLTLKNFGLPQIDRNIGVSMPVWTEITVSDIVVSTGTLQIDMNSNGGVGQFLEMDDISLTLNPALSNSNFSFDTISIYPNPVANNLLNISNPNSENYEVSIFNLLGKNVFSEKNVSGNKTINTNFMSSGIYLLMVSNGTDILTKKVIIP